MPPHATRLPNVPLGEGSDIIYFQPGKRDESMADLQRAHAIQEQIVKGVAGAVLEKWDYILVNTERDEEETQDTLAVAFTKQDDKWSRNGFVVPYKFRQLFLELGRAMANDADERWTTFTLELESGGKYRFSFSYGAPPRLGGTLNDETMFNRYIPQPL
jgi:hypothetical protein